MENQYDKKTVSVFTCGGKSFGLEIKYRGFTRRYNDLSADFDRVSSFAEKLERCGFSMETVDELIEDFLS